MKREKKSSSPPPGYGTMIATNRHMASDYQEATMKLRERALSQNKRNYRNKSLRGAPPFQNRNLDNYPMTYGRDDAVRSASSHRQEKRVKQVNINKTKLDSEALKDYSKQMFNVAVKTVGQNGINVHDNYRNNSRFASESIPAGIRSTASSRLSMRCNTSTSFSDCRRNNGPSREGSVLYNSRQQLLNSIRIRSHSEPVIIFNHDKNKSRPALKEAIDEKNLNYTVRPSRSSLYSRTGSVAGSTFAGSTCSSSDFVLIPLNDNYIDKKYSSDMCFSDLNDSLETDKDLFDEDSELNSVFRPPSQSKSRMLPPSATYGIRLFSLEEDSASESEEEMAHTPGDIKKIDASPQHKPLDKNPSLQEPVDDPEAKGQRLPEAEPEKPAHVKIHLKGPHCWVDDATVTSELSDQEPDESGDKDQASPDDLPKPEVDKAPLVKRISQLEIEQNVEKKPALANDNNQCLENSPDPDIMSLSEVTDDHLPSFLCPSSEKKSREAAIKDWLAHTCFRTGHRGFPMGIDYSLSTMGFKGKRKPGLRLSYKKPSGFYRSSKTGKLIQSPFKSPTPKKCRLGPVGSTPMSNKTLDLQSLSDIISPISKHLIASPSPNKRVSKRKLIYTQPSIQDQCPNGIAIIRLVMGNRLDRDIRCRKG